MSQENAEIVRQAFLATAGGDPAAAGSFYDPALCRTVNAERFEGKLECVADHAGAEPDATKAARRSVASGGSSVAARKGDPA